MWSCYFLHAYVSLLVTLVTWLLLSLLSHYSTTLSLANACMTFPWPFFSFCIGPSFSILCLYFLNFPVAQVTDLYFLSNLSFWNHAHAFFHCFGLLYSGPAMVRLFSSSFLFVSSLLKNQHFQYFWTYDHSFIQHLYDAIQIFPRETHWYCSQSAPDFSHCLFVELCQPYQDCYCWFDRCHRLCFLDFFSLFHTNFFCLGSFPHLYSLLQPSSSFSRAAGRRFHHHWWLQDQKSQIQPSSNLS